jgi:hypothetical protein
MDIYIRRGQFITAVDLNRTGVTMTSGGQILAEPVSLPNTYITNEPGVFEINVPGEFEVSILYSDHYGTQLSLMILSKTYKLEAYKIFNGLKNSILALK